MSVECFSLPNRHRSYDMEIRATEFTRDDGLTLLCTSRQGHGPRDSWVIRRIGPGPAWFYSKPRGWVICTEEGFKELDLALPFSEAWMMFTRLPPAR